MCDESSMGDGDLNIKIYQLDVTQFEDQQSFQKHYAMLSKERRAKIDAYRIDSAKRLSLGAGVLLDKGLREYGLRERDVRVGKGENGKPYLEDYPDIYFNLSHSGNMVLATFADTEVGCDVEEIDKMLEKLAKRFFCPSEYEYLLQQKEEKQCEEFYRLWTLKESFMKVTGLGMKLPLDSFCFQLGDKVTVQQQVDTRQYEFQELDLADKTGKKYKAAICVCVKK